MCLSAFTLQCNDVEESQMTPYRRHRYLSLEFLLKLNTQLPIFHINCVKNNTARMTKPNSNSSGQHSVN